MKYAFYRVFSSTYDVGCGHTMGEKTKTENEMEKVEIEINCSAKYAGNSVQPRNYPPEVYFKKDRRKSKEYTILNKFYSCIK